MKMLKNIQLPKSRFYIFPKSYIWFSLSLIISTFVNIPAWSQPKNDQTQVIVNSEVIQDQVKLRVKVKKNNKLVSNLRTEDFSVYVDCPDDVKNCKPITIENGNWKNPKESTPVPTRIVILLDLSGSMTKKDQGGKRKLEGAIKAIEDFREELEKRGGDTQMVIVPFSDKSTYTECNDDPVENVQLNRFAPPNATQHKQDIRKLQNDLNRELPYIIARENNRKITRPKNSKYRICGETNLYKSLATTISFLRTFNQSTANKNQLNSSPTPNDQQTQPKLHIVLLSDGFNTVPFSDSSDKCDSSHFDELKKYLDPDKITIHTIGYGRDPQALGKDSKYYKYLQGRTPKCEDTLPDRTIKDEKIRQDLESELVDKQHLQEIAELTEGVSEFSGNSQEIAKKFIEILDAIAGEYQITYTQKNVDTAEEHNVQVVVKSVKGTDKYTIPIIFQVPFNLRIWTILFLIILPLGLGIFLIYKLGEQIKKQAL